MFMRSHIVLGIGVLSGTCISFRIRKSEYVISVPVDDQIRPELPLLLHHDGTIMQVPSNSGGFSQSNLDVWIRIKSSGLDSNRSDSRRIMNDFSGFHELPDHIIRARHGSSIPDSERTSTIGLIDSLLQIAYRFWAVQNQILIE